MIALDSDKVAVLLLALGERYEAMRVIRARVQSIGIWALGLMVTGSAWLMVNRPGLTSWERFFVIAAAVVSYSFLHLVYLEDLCKGFKTQQRTAARIEDALQMFSVGIFDHSPTSIYPEGWKHAGSSAGEGSFFASTYMLMVLGLVIFVIAVAISS